MEKLVARVATKETKYAYIFEKGEKKFLQSFEMNFLSSPECFLHVCVGCLLWSCKRKEKKANVTGCLIALLTKFVHVDRH